MKRYFLFLASLFTLFSSNVVFAASNNAVSGTVLKGVDSAKSAVSGIFSNSANFLGESIIPGLLNGQLLYYVIVPLIVSALFLIVLNNIILKKNVDTVMVLVSLGITIGIQFLLKDPLNSAITTTQSIWTQTVGAITSFFANLTGGQAAKDVTEAISLIYAIAIDVILGFVGVICHNLFIDHRSADKSQGIKIVLSQVIVCGAFIALKIFRIAP